MKSIRITVTAATIVLALTALVSTAGAQVFYSYPGAPPVKADHPAIGADIGFGDDLVRLLGYGRFNVMSMSDVGLELIFDKTDTPVESNIWRWGFGADYKIAIAPKDTTTTMPFDLAVDVGFGYQNGGDTWNMRFPVGGVISRPLEFNGDRALVPYGGIYVLFDYVKWNWPAGISGDDSDFEVDVELRAGMGLEISKSAVANATLFLGSGTKLYLGINFVL